MPFKMSKHQEFPTLLLPGALLTRLTDWHTEMCQNSTLWTWVLYSMSLARKMYSFLTLVWLALISTLQTGPLPGRIWGEVQSLSETLCKRWRAQCRPSARQMPTSEEDEGTVAVFAPGWSCLEGQERLLVEPWRKAPRAPERAPSSPRNDPN